MALIITASSLPVFAGTDSKDLKEIKPMYQEAYSDAGFYAAAEGGAQFATGYGNHEQVLSGTGVGTFPPGHNEVFNPSRLHSGWGGVGGIRAGYNFESVPVGNVLRLQPALELEALYIGDNSTSSGTFGNVFDATTVPTESHGTISTNSADLFVNGVFRFKNKSIVTPYIGAGLGGQYLTIHGQANVSSIAGGANITGINGSALAPAAQVFGGFDIAFTTHWSIFTEYKFVDAIGADVKSGLNGYGLTYHLKPDQIQQNLVVAGVKYSF